MRKGIGLSLVLAACDPAGGEGTLQVTAYGESFIEDRIPADEVIDAWEIQFSHFVVGLTEVEADGALLPGHRVVDLALDSGGEGHPIGEIVVDAGQLDALAFHLAFPDDDAVVVGATDPGLAGELSSRGLAMLVEGTARRGDETIGFRWGFAEAGHYHGCPLDRDLADGQRVAAEITIHADHLFYDDLDSETPNVAFDLVASADADGDGEVTADELAAVDISTQARYQVGSRPIDDLWHFIEAQTLTVGHIDGEGHCGG